MLTLGELEDWLWDCACTIRGAVDAPKYKDYILPLIFAKRLSDVFDDEVRELGERLGGLDNARQLVKEDHALVRFYLPEDARWQAIRRLAAPNIGVSLTQVMRDIAKCNPDLQDVIDLIDYAAQVSGQRIIEEPQLEALIQRLSIHPLGLKNVEPDLLGRAYEYLLRKFAEGQGQSAGEFFTPKEVGWLIANSMQAQPGQSVYDPAAGSAGLLIKTQLVATRNNQPGYRPLQIYGQERTSTTFAIARMNMMLHDIDGSIEIGDTLRNPRFVRADGALRMFDRVVANPMWNQPGYGADFYEEDQYERFTAGIPNQSTADWGWLQHIVASLNPRGRAAVVLDAAAVSRGSGNGGRDKERAIRQRFVQDDLIEAVMLLPDNIFYNTPAQGLIIYLNKSKGEARRGQILLIDASREFIKGRPKNILDEDGAQRIVEALLSWSEKDDLSVIVTESDVKERDWNLNPCRYLRRQRVDSVFDRAVVIEQLADLRSRTSTLESDLLGAITDLQEIHINDMIDDSSFVTKNFADVAAFKAGRTPSRKESAYWTPADVGHPWVSISDMAGKRVVEVTKETITDAAAQAVFYNVTVPAQTLLMSFKLTIGRTAFLGVEGYHNEAIISIFPDESQILSRYLYHLLPTLDYTQYQDRAVKGQTLNKSKISGLRLHIPRDIEVQEQIADILDLAESVASLEAQTAAFRSDFRHGLAKGLLAGTLRSRR